MADGELLQAAETRRCTLNIHCRLDPCANETAIRAGLSVQGNNAIHLGKEHVPHITLVLSDFAGDAKTAAARVCDLLQPVAEAYKPVSLTMQDGKLSKVGEYVFWDVEKSDELDTLLEAVLHALVPAYAEEIPLPPWVAAVCSPAEQTKRKEYLQQYGTVNAYEFFRPHVTVGYVSNTGSSSSSSSSSSSGGGGECSGGEGMEPFLVRDSKELVCRSIYVNAVGENGTVLAGHDLGCVALLGRLQQD